MNLIKQKLHQLVTEMQDSKNYYVQPQRDQDVSVVMPGKLNEWVSRLSMLEQELERLTEEVEKERIQA